MMSAECAWGVTKYDDKKCCARYDRDKRCLYLLVVFITGWKMMFYTFGLPWFVVCRDKADGLW